MGENSFDDAHKWETYRHCHWFERDAVRDIGQQLNTMFDAHIAAGEYTHDSLFDHLHLHAIANKFPIVRRNLPVKDTR